MKAEQDISILEAMQGLPSVYKTLCGLVSLGTVRRMQKAGSALEPSTLYAPKEAARFLGLKNVDHISRDLLPRVCQPQGRIRGVYIMAYQGLISFEEARQFEAGLTEQVRQVAHPSA